MMAIITALIITILIATPLNYRTAVPSGSDFSRFTKFPEVYHGERITTAPF